MVTYSAGHDALERNITVGANRDGVEAQSVGAATRYIVKLGIGHKGVVTDLDQAQ